MMFVDEKIETQRKDFPAVYHVYYVYLHPQMRFPSDYGNKIFFLIILYSPK